MNIFARATKLKLLFASVKGQVALQDLWDLPLSGLRNMANKLNRGLAKPDDLFATTSTAAESNDKLRLSIIIEIIEYRTLESESKVSAAEKSQELKSLRELINTKKIEAKGKLSIEELEKMEADLANS